MKMKKSNLWLFALCILVISTTTILSTAVSAATTTPVMYTLTVTPINIGKATIDITPPGTAIKTATTLSYPAGTVVTLTANNYIVQPETTGWMFQSWSGDVTGSARTITITMDGNKSVTAQYGVVAVDWWTPTPTGRRITPTPTRRVTPTATLAPTPTPTPVTTVTYTLTVSSVYIGTNTFVGSLDVNPPGTTITATTTFTYDAGTVVTLKANNKVVSMGEYQFGYWSGAVTGSQNPIPITMDGNKSVTANYRLSGTTPTVRPTPTRGVTPTPTGRPTGIPTPTSGLAPYVVNYTVQSDWGNGATVSVTIKNSSAAAVNGWTLAWTFSGNQTITNLWNGSFTQTGANVSVKDGGHNANIPAGGGTVNFGYNLNYSGTNAKPTSFTLNGTPCIIQ